MNKQTKKKNSKAKSLRFSCSSWAYVSVQSPPGILDIIKHKFPILLKLDKTICSKHRQKHNSSICLFFWLFFFKWGTINNAPFTLLLACHQFTATQKSAWAMCEWVGSLCGESYGAQMHLIYLRTDTTCMSSVLVTACLSIIHYVTIVRKH